VQLPFWTTRIIGAYHDQQLFDFLQLVFEGSYQQPLLQCATAKPLQLA
jgi:hypothetical protein